MATESASEQRQVDPPYVKILVVYACVLVMGMGLAWAFLSMRAVAGVASDGSWLIAIAIPAMLIAMFVGSGVGMSIGAPALLLPMWALLFTSLGWNFFDYGFTDGIDVGFIVCGVLFWAMALPAWVWMAKGFWSALRKKLKLEETEEPTTKRDRKIARMQAAERQRMWAGGALAGSLWWWLIYAVLYGGGALFGVATYAAAA